MLAADGAAGKRHCIAVSSAHTEIADGVWCLGLALRSLPSTAGAGPIERSG